LDENHLDDYTAHIEGDDTGTKSQLFRGQHSFQTGLGDSNQENQEIRNLDSNTHEQSRSYSVEEVTRPSRIQSMELENHENHHKQENIPVAKERMYPTEIMNIEKMYFTKISNADLSKNLPSHPLLPKDTENEKKPELMMEEKQILHPLQVGGEQFDTHNEIQFRGEHWYEKGLNDDSTDGTDDNKDDEKKFGKSNPMRGDHSYQQTLNDVESMPDKVATEYKSSITKQKQTKSRIGPHPFRGLLLRKQ